MVGGVYSEETMKEGVKIIKEEYEKFIKNIVKKLLS